MPATLEFDAGTITLEGIEKDDPRIAGLTGLTWDARAARYRAPALSYAPVVLALRKAGIAYEDRARKYSELAHGVRVHREPRPYQAEALAA